MQEKGGKAAKGDVDRIDARRLLDGQRKWRCWIFFVTGRNPCGTSCIGRLGCFSFPRRLFLKLLEPRRQGLRHGFTNRHLVISGGKLAERQPVGWQWRPTAGIPFTAAVRRHFAAQDRLGIFQLPRSKF